MTAGMDSLEVVVRDMGATSGSKDLVTGLLCGRRAVTEVHGGVAQALVVHSAMITMHFLNKGIKIINALL